MKKKWKIGGIVLALAFIVIQFFQPLKTNPPVESLIDAPPEVLKVLERSCFDCHSHETQWPWYSNVAPASWLVVGDVNKGRKRLNFSRWGSYDEFKREKKLEEIIEEVDEGRMPLPAYLLLHRNAELSDDDKNVLRQWVLAQKQPE